jgi:hypothetical protein
MTALGYPQGTIETFVTIPFPVTLPLSSALAAGLIAVLRLVPNGTCILIDGTDLRPS